MSVQALTWVLDRSPAEHADRLVLLSLANHAHADGSSTYPSVATIAREARLSTRAVQYALQSLLRGGLELTPAECRARGVAEGTRSGAAIAAGVERGPNGARVYAVLMDDGARAFKSSKRPTNRSRRPATDAAEEGATQTLRPVDEARDVSRIAPSGVQSGAAEGCNVASHGKEPSSDPSRNRHPPTPASGGAPAQSAAPEEEGLAAPPRPETEPGPAAPADARGAARPVPPPGRRKRDHDRFRRDLAAWERGRSASAPHLDDLPDEVLAAWTRSRTELRRVVDPDTFATWLDDLHPHAISDRRLVLGVPEPERLAWIRDRFSRVIAATVAMGFSAPLEVAYVACDHGPSTTGRTPS